MDPDEQQIRDLIDAWMQASQAGDADRLHGMMAEDVVFLRPGLPPMRGRAAFVAGFRNAMDHVRLELLSNIQEITLSGDLAFCWNQLNVTAIPRRGGPAMRHSGNVLSMLRKLPEGNWVIARDANMLIPEAMQ